MSNKLCSQIWNKVIEKTYLDKRLKHDLGSEISIFLKNFRSGQNHMSIGKWIYDSISKE